MQSMLLKDFWKIWSRDIATFTLPSSKVSPASPMKILSHLTKFVENAELCIPRGLRATRRSRYLLARSVIKRHLTIHLPSAQPDIQVNTFPSLESKAFKEYLHTSPIHFVAVHDGAGKPGQDSNKHTITSDVLAKTLLRGMIWYFNTHKLNVAIINRIEFRDSKVFTMIVESFTPPSELRLRMTTQFMEEINESKSLLADTQKEYDEESELSINRYVKYFRRAHAHHRISQLEAHYSNSILSLKVSLTPELLQCRYYES